MAIDANIPLQGTAIDTATPLRNLLDLQTRKKEAEREAKSADLQDQLTQEQIAKKRFENLSARERSRTMDTLIGGAQLNTYLKAGDIEGAKTFLQNRKKRLGERIAAGEDIDTVETDGAIRILGSDDPEAIRQLSAQLDQGERFGRMMGWFEAPSQAGSGGATGELVDKLMKERSASGKPISFEQALYQVQTGFRKGTTYDADGNIVNAPGATDAAASMEEAKASGKARGVPMPATIVEKQDALIDEIATAQAIKADVDEFYTMIDEGKLDLNLGANLANMAKNNLNMSDEQSRNYQSFRSTLEKIRNDSLRLNKGVQTEGDAVRAWNELIANLNDPENVKQRLSEIKSINNRAMKIRENRLGVMRSEYSRAPLDMKEITAPADTPAPQGGSQRKRVSFGDLK